MSPGVRTTRGSDKTERRRRLRQAALTLFEQRGFAAVSIDDIAAAAGVSRRTFFNHFDTKAGALFDPAPGEAAQVADLLVREIDADPWVALTRALKVFLTAEFRTVSARRRILAGQPELSRFLLVTNTCLEEPILDWLGSRGVIGLSARTMSSMALSCVRESVMAWDSEGGPAQLFEILDQMFALAAAGTAAICAAPAAGTDTATDKTTPKAGQTRSRILLTAERLFAEHGVFAVSNRQISEAAGQSNNAAVGYHFGTKADLLRAIVEHHTKLMERIREQLLRARGDSTDLRDWVACVVLPFTEHLSSLETPTWYARLAAQIMTEPQLRELAAAGLHDAPNFYTVVGGLHRCLPALSPELRRRRDDMARTLLVHICAHRERTLPADADAARAAWADTAAELIDAIEGLYLAPATER
ncbi:TetR/AcrR family transcriptional regulator [Nonomuraea aurantiaca]|uniref:TetR/AcrR family transcriptional regulator n=1 Tax=Nonomuraea aurantiaca TaxID=2878562 RepID=UPI001CD9316F|nr:TetR family transcriptional regulator [Nonomuraea aurantiaca]MCA2225962.1 TetR family transcriptional regulator [Nonomuraea aurantiaca]